MPGNLQTGPILVVDDSRSTLQLISLQLQSQGYRIETAQGGEQALAQLEANAPDLVLLDINMPGMDGYEVCRQIKTRPKFRDVPVIFLSAFDDTDSKVKGLESGGVDFITKPFKLDELQARVNIHLQLLHSRRQIEHKNRELEHLVAELNTVQSHLFHSEKMASLGTLAAGVAHEINNPIGFISSNLSSFSHYVGDLLKLVGLYEGLEPQIAGAVKLDNIHAFKKEIDLNYLKDDIQDLLTESNGGVVRVRKIVQDLKEFAHPHSQERVLCDLHQGIDSTLNVVWHELKTRIEVVKEFADLPKVRCTPNKINQVVMNLLINASQAINERGTIWIRTGAEHQGEKVWIEIEDDGCGIPAANQERLFEPFFTTKPIGKGTGLGLSLAHGIIDDHQGSIQVDSEPGKGSRFRITLPVNAGH